MIPFIYRDFWDVPRCILLELRGAHILLVSSFDDELDDFADEYVVYELPGAFDPPQDWTGLERHALRCLGTIPIRDVRFDRSLRETIAEESLAPVIAWLAV